MANIQALTVSNAERWKDAKLTRGPEFTPVANRLVAAKERYSTIQRMTGVPWWVIAVIHERESSQDFSTNLAQGDPWNKVSTHQPKGRGPFSSFEAAAVDALVNCAPYAGRWKDWTSGGTMTLLEQYNGLGYANRGLPSPYLWSGTDQYSKGKYVADGVFDPDVVDKQLGCAGLIMAMQAIDHTIHFADPPPDIPAPEIVSQQPASGGFFNALNNAVLSVFKRS
jgi:lysozyme family protein